MALKVWEKSKKCHVDCTATNGVAWMIIPWYHGFGGVKDVTTTFILDIGMPGVRTDEPSGYGHVSNKIYWMDRLPNFF